MGFFIFLVLVKVGEESFIGNDVVTERFIKDSMVKMRDLGRLKLVGSPVISYHIYIYVAKRLFLVSIQSPHRGLNKVSD
jgi:hypothetical protein